MSLIRTIEKFTVALREHDFYNLENSLDQKLSIFKFVYSQVLNGFDRDAIPGNTHDKRKYELSTHINDQRVSDFWFETINGIVPKKYVEKSKDEFYLVIANNSKPEDYINYIQRITDKKVVVIDNNELDKYKHTDIDLLLFTGGEDVSPEFYGEKVGKYTGISKSRDEIEQKIFHKFGNNIPKLGICRGAQFLTVMAGGKLIQHVENHTRAHSIVLFQEHKFLSKNELTSTDYNVTSTHHQMMYPYNLTKKEYEIIAFSKLHLSETYLNGDDEEIKKPLTFVECEIVYYPRTNSLCIQAHPEYMDVKDKFVNKTIDLIKTKLFKNEQ